jgi:hypothetical protein
MKALIALIRAQRPVREIFIRFLLASLAACGGGGSGSPSTTGTVAGAALPVSVVLEGTAGGPTLPAQFIAKIHTEALGRIPDQAAWSASLEVFRNAGCGAAQLQAWGRSVYLSAEYASLGYDNASRVLTLYRGVLNREPDAAGFSDILAMLDGGAAWPAVVDRLFGSAEFASLSPALCAGTPTYFGSAPAIPLPVSGPGFSGGTGEQLQSLLDRTLPGGTVFLAPKALVQLSAPLVIPAGVTLATTGLPSHNSYAGMGRLVRAAAFDQAAVQLKPGAKLTSVWVDGQRGAVGFRQNAINIQVHGGAGTEVSNSVSSNTAGWSSLQAFGSAEGLPCGRNIIANNLVTVYSSNHTDGTWSDGLSIACENATVENNQIVDATDAAIVLFRASPAVQRSVVRRNTILSAGNSAFGAIIADPLHGTGARHSFAGSSIADNRLWTGPNTSFEIALSVGTRAWFGTSSDMGAGASFTGNNTGSLSVRTDCAICVSGMLDATVQDNDLATQLVRVHSCPLVDVGASVSAGYASGTIQRGTDVLIEGCVNR